MNNLKILTIDDFLLGKYCLRKLQKKLQRRNFIPTKDAYHNYTLANFAELPHNPSQIHKLVEEYRSKNTIRNNIQTNLVDSKQVYPGQVSSLIHAYDESIFSIHSRSTESLSSLVESKSGALFDLVLIVQERLCFIDLIQYKGQYLTISLIKSDTKIHTDYYWEAAWTSQALNHLGYHIQDCYVQILNKNREPLCIEKHLKNSQKFMRSSMSDQISQLENTINNSYIPTCKNLNCPLCNKKEPTLSDLHELHQPSNIIHSLKNQGIYKIADINKSSYSTQAKIKKSHWIQHKAIVENAEHINYSAITEFLNGLEWPLFFLDFECFHEAIPSWKYTGAWEHAPFLYSLHSMNKDLKPRKISTFLIPAGNDERSEMAEHLLQAIGKTGSILVYGMQMEKAIIHHLARVAKHLNNNLLTLVPRLVDIQLIFKNFYYYHPKQHGKFSLKSIVNILTNLNYSSVHNTMGNNPFLGYYFLIHKNIRVHWNDYANRVRQNPQQFYQVVREYCDLDSISLAYILKELIHKCNWGFRKNGG